MLPRLVNTTFGAAHAPRRCMFRGGGQSVTKVSIRIDIFGTSNALTIGERKEADKSQQGWLWKAVPSDNGA